MIQLWRVQCTHAALGHYANVRLGTGDAPLACSTACADALGCPTRVAAPPRTPTTQVLSNSLGGCLAAVLASVCRHSDSRLALPLGRCAAAAFVAHYACCTADTWASEVGITAPSWPLLLTQPWRRVPPGTNGGVSAAGSAAAAAGSAAVGGLWVFMSSVTGGAGGQGKLGVWEGGQCCEPELRLGFRV